MVSLHRKQSFIVANVLRLKLNWNGQDILYFGLPFIFVTDKFEDFHLIGL